MGFRDRVRQAFQRSSRTEERATGHSGGVSRLGYGGSITHGGIRNPWSGLGQLGVDKSEGSFFVPTRFWWRSPLEVLYVQSGAAKKFVNIPIEDMFVRWRTWMDGNVDGAAEVMEKAESKHQVTHRLSQAMKAARAYGTGCAILMTTEAPMDTPLVPERIREGDLKAIRVLDRFDMSVLERDKDMFSPGFGGPISYMVHPTGGYAVPMRVHASRVVRFDGISPLTDSRYYNYEEDWGVSELVPVIVTLIEDQSLAAAIAHLSQEASIPILSVNGLRDLLIGRGGRGEASADDIGSSLNRMKSVYNMLMVDGSSEKFERVAVQFGGLFQLMTAFSERLASMGDIPMTRWQGRSPGGLNSSGDSDMKNYVIMLEARREKMLAHCLPILDEVLARDAGLGEVPEFEWRSLLDLSEEEQATVAKSKAEALSVGISNSIITEDEAREALDGDALFGALPGAAPEPELPEMGMEGDPFAGLDAVEPDDTVGGTGTTEEEDGDSEPEEEM